jgi:hypothetical protein
MRFASSLLAAVIVLPATAALAKDRPVTDQERPKLEAALKEVGCSGGQAMRLGHSAGLTYSAHKDLM